MILKTRKKQAHISSPNLLELSTKLVQNNIKYRFQY